MRSYFRLNSPDDPPERLLDPERQSSEPWGGTIYGRCDKCGGSGQTEYEREGEVDECPACEGSGEIDDSARDGVSVFPDEDGLYRYMIKRDADLDDRCQLVELEGEKSDDEDFDADEGALLVHPRRIVATGSLDWDRIEELREELAANEAG